jgi:hypothetical protein
MKSDINSFNLSITFLQGKPKTARCTRCSRWHQSANAYRMAEHLEWHMMSMSPQFFSTFPFSVLQIWPRKFRTMETMDRGMRDRNRVLKAAKKVTLAFDGWCNHQHTCTLAVAALAPSFGCILLCLQETERETAAEWGIVLGNVVQNVRSYGAEVVATIADGQAPSPFFCLRNLHFLWGLVEMQPMLSGLWLIRLACH